MFKYYIGDLCYILPNDLYDEIVCSFKYDTGKWTTVNGVRFAFSNTAHGDGKYLGSDGFYYPVDAGLIGIVKLEGFEPRNIKTPHCGALGKVIEFETEPTVDMHGGVFKIGDIVIDTTDDCEEEYYE